MTDDASDGKRGSNIMWRKQLDLTCLRIGRDECF